MTTKAPSIEPLATPNDADAAPPAGGAGAAPVAEAALVADEPADLVPDAVLDTAPDVMVVFPLEKLALGPTALFDTVLTAPVIVARLDTTLATGTDELETTTSELDGVGFVGNVTCMRISSHCAPIHSSYRL